MLSQPKRTRGAREEKPDPPAKRKLQSPQRPPMAKRKLQPPPTTLPAENLHAIVMRSGSIFAPPDTVCLKCRVSFRMPNFL